jgi:SAM-dependent methyltransferase
MGMKNQQNTKLKLGVLKELGIFPREFAEKIIRSISTHIPNLESVIDVGHAKDLRPVRELARRFEDTRFVYYDNNESYIRNLRTQREAANSGLPARVIIASPEDVQQHTPFQLAVYYYTLHHFHDQGQSPLQSLQEIWQMLEPGALVLVKDYHLRDPSGRPLSKQDVKTLFEQTLNEKKIVTEGSGKFEPDWYGHVDYDLTKCQRDAKQAGFAEVEAHVEQILGMNKFFLYVGRKPKNDE